MPVSLRNMCRSRPDLGGRPLEPCAVPSGPDVQKVPYCSYVFEREGAGEHRGSDAVVGGDLCPSFVEDVGDAFGWDDNCAVGVRDEPVARSDGEMNPCPFVVRCLGRPLRAHWTK